uniref:Uncharacterized protein n=1 Tax=uncultured bacterium 8 TaxID=1136413 RepID=A0A0U3TRI9_9BACT|nr:hypothetical protein [uncultured bacterium 8]
MKASLKVRIATLLASIGTTLALVFLIAGYAYPEGQPESQPVAAALPR